MTQSRSGAEDRRKQRRLDESRRQTDELRNAVAVGVGETYAEALNHAWEVAKERGAGSRRRYRVVDHTGRGVNPFTDHKVVIIPAG